MHAPPAKWPTDVSLPTSLTPVLRVFMRPPASPWWVIGLYLLVIGEGARSRRSKLSLLRGGKLTTKVIYYCTKLFENSRERRCDHPAAC
jgi:hypothetical protein